MKEKINEFLLEDIFRKYLKTDLSNEWKDKKLMGQELAMPARETVLLLFEIEEMFNIKFTEEQILEKRFDTFNHIKELIYELQIE